MVTEKIQVVQLTSLRVWHSCCLLKRAWFYLETRGSNPFFKGSSSGKFWKGGGDGRGGDINPCKIMITHLGRAYSLSHLLQNGVVAVCAPSGRQCVPPHQLCLARRAAPLAHIISKPQSPPAAPSVAALLPLTRCRTLLPLEDQGRGWTADES